MIFGRSWAWLTHAWQNLRDASDVVLEAATALTGVFVAACCCKVFSSSLGISTASE
jgi:hypothetical protein